MAIGFTIQSVASVKAVRYMPNNSNGVSLQTVTTCGERSGLDVYFHSTEEALIFFRANGGIDSMISFVGKNNSLTTVADVEASCGVNSGESQ